MDNVVELRQHDLNITILDCYWEAGKTNFERYLIVCDADICSELVFYFKWIRTM